jgi:HK97 family phage prohead protease
MAETSRDMPRFVPIECQLSVDSEKREVTFYGAAFRNRDAQAMRILDNAFSKTIQEQLPQGLVKHYRNHTTPVGPMRHLSQDGHGLLCVGYCSKTRDGDEYLEQAKDGTLTHGSIYAKIVRERAEWVTEKNAEGKDVETLNLGELILIEAGLVNLIPANPLATLVAVKSMGESETLDLLLDLDYVVKSFVLSSDREKLNADERRVAKALLGLQRVLNEQGDVLKALLAPGDLTHSSGNAPSLATPADAEKKIDLAMLLDSVQKLRRIEA